MELSERPLRVVSLTLCLVAGLLVGCREPSGQAEGNLSPPHLLKTAWEEYGFQAWNQADRLFDQVILRPNATDDQKYQAKLGKAFIVQNKMPGRSAEGALKLFEALLQDLPNSHPLRPLVQSSLGACYLDSKKPDYEQGRAYLQEVLDNPDADPLVAQDAALRLLASYLKRPDPEQYSEGLRRSEAVISRVRGTPMESVLHWMAGRLALWTGDLRRFADETEAQYRCGIENRALLESALFTLGRLNEAVFADYACAADWYEQISKDLPTHGRGYFGRLRAAELRAGKINSDYEPPLVPETAPVAGQGSQD